MVCCLKIFSNNKKSLHQLVVSLDKNNSYEAISFVDKFEFKIFSNNKKSLHQLVVSLDKNNSYEAISCVDNHYHHSTARYFKFTYRCQNVFVQP
jgi:orotidine-5'-phosphate decarboxylase